MINLQDKASIKDGVCEYLLNIADECQLDDWDGDGAKAISKSIIHSTWTFLNILSNSQLLGVEIEPDADGEVSLSWHKADNVLTISMGDNSRIAFAGLFGELEWCGKEQFDNKTIPHSISSYIERLHDTE